MLFQPGEKSSTTVAPVASVLSRPYPERNFVTSPKISYLGEHGFGVLFRLIH
jgi:hypothetical protein